MAAHVLGTFGAIVLASVLFTVPLVLKFHVFKPEVKHVETGDVFEVEGRISSTWCQAVDLSSNSSFQSFLYDSNPAVSETDIRRTVTVHQAVLPNNGQKYWGFHLLRGSMVNVSTCVRLFGGDLTVVKGYKALRRCLAEHKYILEIGDDISGEESQSESESDDVTSSISSSQGAISNETDRMYRCWDAIHHAQLPSAYGCRASELHSVRKETLYQFIEHSDRYYYIFSSNTYLDIIPNEFSIEFAIDRTHYNHTSSINNCSSSEHCQMDISLGSDEKIVVQMAGVNGSFKTEKITIACKPRESCENSDLMKWEDLAKQLTDAAEGFGKCQFAAIHSLEDGVCLGKHPKEAHGVSSEEIALVSRAFRDPTMLYSSGIPLRGIKFTYVKVEGSAILGRTPTLACLVMQTDKAYIICIYPGGEMTSNVYKNCLHVYEKMKDA